MTGLRPFWSLFRDQDKISPASDQLAHPAPKKDGKIKGRVAAINIGIELSVEMANAFLEAASPRPPVSISSLDETVHQASRMQRRSAAGIVMATNPDAFFSFKLPPDAFMATD